MKRYNLGNSWRCSDCKKKHKLEGAYLAAHWTLSLQFTCDCGTVYKIQAGILERLGR